MIKKNPLKNYRVMVRLNPYVKVQKKAAKYLEEKRKAERQTKRDERRGVSIVPVL